MGVRNKEGALYFATGIDNSGLRKDSEEAKRYLRDIADFAKGAGVALGAAFSVTALKQFGKEIINVRGEMQMLETSFDVLLGGRGVPAFMKELNQFAIDSPLSLTGVANAAQTLLGFNVAAKDVIPTIKQIGDISMGNEQRFASLSLAFAQMSATGKLMGQDLNQMINAGFNPLQEISDRTGKSISVLKKEMEDGSLSAEMIADAFASATAEGGRFYGMTQKQAEGIRGLQAQLQGAFQEMFNDLGKSQEDLISTGYKGVTSLVENYEQVGKAIAGVIGVLGVYKTAQMAAHAYDNVTASIKYAEEAKSLEALLTVEEKKRVSKKNLKIGTEEHVKAIQKEIEAREQSLLAQRDIGIEETNSLARRQIEAKKAREAASENVAIRKAELAAIIGNAETEKTVALQKKMLVESEKQSRAALLVNKLEEKKADAIVQAQDLKTIGATEEKIAAKNREIATIHKKIVAAKEEEVQHARNIVALRSEAATVSGSVTSKKIESAEKKLNTAIIKENTIAQSHNAIMKEKYALKAKTMSASQQLETLSTNVDTASKKTNITFTTLLAAAKTRLTAVAVRLNAALAANAFSIAIAGAAALTYGLYKLITYQTTAEKQQKKLNEALGVERMQFDALVESFKRAEPGTERYRQLKSDLNDLVGESANHLNLEIDALRYSKDAYFQLSAEIERNTRAKLRNQFIDENNQELGKSIGSSYSSLRKRLMGDLGAEDGKQAFADIKSRIEDATLQDAFDINKYIRTIFEESGKSFNLSARKYYQDVNSILSSKHRLQEVLEEADDIFGDAGDGTQKTAQDINQQIEETKTKIATLKKDLADLRSGTTASTDYKADIEAKEKELKSANETLETLTGQSEKLLKLNERVRSDAQKQVDLALELEKAGKERELATRQTEIDIAQARIDMMEDGFAKQEKQIELNHNKELLSLQKRTRQLIEAQQNIERKEWEKAGSKGIFRPTTNSANQLPSDQQKELNDLYGLSWERYKKNQEDNLKSLLDQYRTHEEQRLAIVKKYDAERTRLASENIDGKLDKNIEVLNKQEDEELAMFDTRIQSKTSIMTRMFSDMSDKSIEELKRIRDEAEALWEFLSGGQWDNEKGTFFEIKKEQFDDIIADPDKLSKFKNGVNEIRDAIFQLDSPINQIKEGLTELFNPDLAGTNKQIAALDKIQKGYEKYADAVSLVSGAIGALGELTDSGALKSVSDGLNDILSVANDTMSGAKVGAQVGGAAGAVVGGILGAAKGLFTVLSRNKQHQEELKKQIQENQRQEYFGQLEVEELYRRKYEWAKRIGEATLSHIKREGEELKKQTTANAKAQDELWKKLRKEQYKSGEHFERTGFLGLGRGRIVTEWSSLAGKTWKQIETLAAQGKLSEEGMKYYEALKSAKEEGQDIESMQLDYLERLREVTTGSPYDSVVSGIVDGFKQGKRSASDFADSFEDLMQNAIQSSLRLLADQEMRKWYEDFAKAGEDGYTEKEIEDLKRSWIELNKSLAVQAEHLEEITGRKIGDVGSGVTGELKAQMTEQTGSQLVGLWNMTAMDIREIKEFFKQNGVQDVSKEINNLLNELQAIRENTKSTAENTSYNQAGFKRLEDQLEEIKRNTKPNNSRG